MEPSSSSSFISPFAPYSCGYLTPKHMFPSNYKFVKRLGQGGFGEVLQCIKKDTKETVAVKVPKYGCSFNNELRLLNFFMWKKLDKCNIVRFIESFTLKDNRPALAFEMLDMTLKDYFCKTRDFTPLDLPEVRSVVQQMATALEALKSLEVIHSDIKLDNIMLVDREQQPLRVKLIDFGLAFPTCRARQGATHQTVNYRAPEIMLGLPFAEAIDMWSLGVVLAFVMLGYKLFPGDKEYELMQCIVDLLGLPPDNLLNAAMYSEYYFKKCSGHWRLMTPQEYWGESTPPSDCRTNKFHSLDAVQTLPLENLNIVTADERKECLDLLMSMLQIDSKNRISPHQILDHPFITRETLQHSSDSETLECSSDRSAEERENIQTPEPETKHSAESTILTDETQKKPKIDEWTNEILGTTSTIPQHLVQPPQTAAGLLWDEGRDIFGPSLLPGFVLAGLTQRSLLMDKMWLGVSDTFSSGSRGSVASTSESLPPGFILVQPAPHERCLKLEGDNEEQRGACPLDYLEDISDNTTVAQDLQSCRDKVRPPESTTQYDPSPSLPEDCNVKQEHTEFNNTTSDTMEPEVEEKKKKKKNCFMRFSSCMKMIFYSCRCVCKEED